MRRLVAETLTSIGLEVEAIEDKGAGLKDFIVAHVVSAEKHPNADKLKLCMVDTGEDIVQVVCGAPNAHTGMKGRVREARHGHSRFRRSAQDLEPSAAWNRAACCVRERELLLSDEHQGIIELPADAVVGAPAAIALGIWTIP